jgi:hypothetical protein
MIRPMDRKMPQILKEEYTSSHEILGLQVGHGLKTSKYTKGVIEIVLSNMRKYCKKKSLKIDRNYSCSIDKKKRLLEEIML